MDDWKNVLFSDETKINVNGSDGVRYVWKRPEEPLSERLTQKTVRFGGGSVMVWSCFGFKGTGFASKITGGVNSEIYKEVLEDENAFKC